MRKFICVNTCVFYVITLNLQHKTKRGAHDSTKLANKDKTKLLQKQIKHGLNEYHKSIT